MFYFSFTNSRYTNDAFQWEVLIQNQKAVTIVFGCFVVFLWDGMMVHFFPHLSSHRARWSGLCCLNFYNVWCSGSFYSDSRLDSGPLILSLWYHIQSRSCWRSGVLRGLRPSVPVSASSSQLLTRLTCNTKPVLSLLTVQLLSQWPVVSVFELHVFAVLQCSCFLHRYGVWSAHVGIHVYPEVPDFCDLRFPVYQRCSLFC